MPEASERGIFAFFGGYRWLSNFYPSPITDANGTVWPTVEHYYQAMKSTTAEDARLIHAAVRPGDAKRAGRSIIIRSDWEQIKDGVMMWALATKFAPGTEFAQLLLDTRTMQLIEGNEWHDNYWGNCRCGAANCLAPGRNVLGEMLMDVRDTLRRQQLTT